MTSARLSLLNCEKRAMNPHVQMMRHRLWIIAFTTMGAIAYYVIGALLYLSQQKQWSDGMWNEMTALQIAEQYAHYMQDHVRHFYGFCSYGFVVVIFLAIIMGLEGYAYLHKMQTMDFYESQPLSRGKRFTLIYLNGWKIFASIWGVATLLGVAIGALYGGMNVAVLAEIAVEFVFLCILFFGVYNITIFASTISKNNVVATFLTMIFLAAEAGYRLLAQELMEAYFPTYYKYSYISNTYNMKNWFTSPIANYVTGRMQAVEVQRYNLVTVGRVGLAVKNMMVSEVLALVIGVVFLVLAYIAFCRRPSESVGQGLVYRWMEGVTKIMVAIPLGALTGLIMDAVFSTFYATITALNVFMIILVLVLFCFIVEVICNGSIKAFYKRPWQVAIAVALSFAFFLIYRMDIIGFNRYVPKESEIADVVLIDGSAYQTYFKDDSPYDNVAGYDGYGYGIDRDAYLEEAMHLKDIDAGIQIARIGLAERVKNYHSNASWNGYDATIMFHMKDGSLVARTITIPLDVDEELMNRLVGTDEYRQAVYQLDYLEAKLDEVGMDLNVQYSYGYGSFSLEKNQATVDGLIAAYRKDLRTLNFSKLKNKHTIGEIYFTANGPEQYFDMTYPVFEDFTNTIAYLDSKGCYHTSEVPAELVTQLNIYGDIAEGSTHYYGDLYYEDPDLAAQIAPYLHLYLTHDWSAGEDAVSVGVTITGEYEGCDYNAAMGNYQLPVDKLPQSVVEDIKNAGNSYTWE